MKSIDRVMAQVEIRWPEASWVLGAHLYAVLLPLVLVFAVDHHWDYLLENTFRPALFYVVTGIIYWKIPSDRRCFMSSWDYFAPAVLSRWHRMQWIAGT